MIDRYIEINRIIRRLYRVCQEGIDAETGQAGGYAEAMLVDFLRRELRELRRLWPEDLPQVELESIQALAGQPDAQISMSIHAQTYRSIMFRVLPDLEDRLDAYFGSRASGGIALEVIDLLHPAIFEASYGPFRAGRYRDAVLNGIVAVFDLIRQRTGLDSDGAKLVGEVFGLDNPALVFSEVQSESGRSDQKGFLQIIQGAYIGIRNPKAHTLASDLDHRKALQYLIFASILARRVEEARDA